MNTLKVAQRIRAHTNTAPINAVDAIDLGHKLDRLGVTKGTYAEYGIEPSLRLIGEALAFGEARQMFELLAVTPADFSVRLQSSSSQRQYRSGDELLSTPGMFVGTRGIEHIWDHVLVQ